MTIHHEAEQAAAFVRDLEIEGSTFELAVADDMTFAGEADPIGIGMAVIVDACLERGFEPDGFEQRDGYRVYRYRAVEASPGPDPG